MDADDSSHAVNGNGKRKLWIACNACRFRKVKCDREPRLEQGFSSCTNCEAAAMECVLTVNPPKKRMGKRMKMLQEQMEANAQAPAKTQAQDSAHFAPLPSDGRAHMPSDPSQFFSHNIAMSPGLSSLLQAVSQEESSLSASVSDSSFAVPPDPVRTPFGAGTTSAYSSTSSFASNAPIIQNGMFAAIGSSGENMFASHLSADISSADPSRRPSLDNGGATTHAISSTSPVNSSDTPRSAAVASEQSSPDVIPNESFLSKRSNHARHNLLKRQNPLETPTVDSTVGFVGGLLGIASLDKHMLDTCTRSYFESVGQCIGFIRPEWYWPRYHLFFSRYAGSYIDETTQALGADLRPLSELLLIAVACRGAGATSFANRFDLQKNLDEHYQRLIKDRSRLVRDGFDGLESLILMVEHADGRPKPIVDPMSVKGVFDIEMLSHEGLIRLLKKLELHLEKPFGNRLEGRDAVRQRIVFWTVYVYDAIRSEAGRTLPLISEDEISLSLNLPVMVDPARIAFRDHCLGIARICRKVASKVQSPRAQQLGVEPSAAIEVLDDLRAWYDKLGPAYRWDWNDMLHITGPTSVEDQIRRTFLTFLYLGQWLTLQYAIDEIGILPGCEEAVRDQMLARLEGELHEAMERQVLVCDHGTMFGIIRLYPGLMQSWTITWAMWSIRKMNEIVAEESNGRIASAKADQAFHRYQSAVLCFINAIASCDSVPHTPTTVQNTMDALRKVTEARKLARVTFDSL